MVFTNAVGQVDATEGMDPADAAPELMAAFGAGYRPLVHRGPVTIHTRLPQQSSNEGAALTLCNYPSENNNNNGYALKIDCGRAKFDGPIEITGNARVIQWAVATIPWVNAVDSYVDCNKASDELGSISSGTVRVYLPRPGTDILGAQKTPSDPNIQVGDVIGYIHVVDGSAVCVTDYLDDTIGTIRVWQYDEDQIPKGWSLLPTAKGRHLVGYKENDLIYGSLGATGGSKAHFHTGSTDMNAGPPVPVTGDVDDAVGLVTSAVSLGVSGTGSVYSVISSGAAIPTTSAGDHTHLLSATAPRHSFDSGSFTNSYVFADTADLLSSVDGNHNHTVSCDDIAADMTYDSGDVISEITSESHSHQVVDHSHSVNLSASQPMHYHSYSVEEAKHIKKTIVVNFIRRSS